MNWLRSLALAALHSDCLRGLRHRWFMRARARPPAHADEGATPIRVLVLGIYMADRPNTAAHLVAAFASSERIQVEQRWVALKGVSKDPAVRKVTTLVEARPQAKFGLVNRVLSPSDAIDFDYVIVCDDDIYLPRGFLPAFIAYQQQFDFALAQPSRAWHSHFDHAFVLRRPWLRARQTLFVECGPLVSIRQDAARSLLPFDQQDEMWGIDLVWAELIERQGLKMGIIDALSVDHSMRPQASTYNKVREEAAMNAYLLNRPHMPMHKAFSVIRRHR